MFGPLNKKKKQEKNQINKTLKSKFIYEDCFVYDESRFTGKKIHLFLFNLVKSRPIHMVVTTCNQVQL